MDLNSGFIVKLPTRKEYFLTADAILACCGPVLVWAPPQGGTCSIVLWNISACATQIFASRLFHPCQTAPRWHHRCFPALVKTALPLFMHYCNLEYFFSFLSPLKKNLPPLRKHSWVALIWVTHFDCLLLKKTKKKLVCSYMPSRSLFCISLLL